MRVLFVYPNVTRPRTPQMGLLALGSYLIHHGVEVAICDLTFVEATRFLDYILADIARHKPDLLGFSIRTMEFPVVRELLKEIRNRHPDLLIIAGGHHATLVPNDLVGLVDFGVAGDGEEVCLEIVQALADGRRAHLHEIQSLFYLRDETLIRNPLRAMFDLANAPLPRFELFDERHYREHSFLRLVPGASVCGVFEGSRGCPYQCTYCSNAALMDLNKQGGRWRREKDVGQLRREIDHFRARYGLDMIYFVDEVIMTSDARTLALKEGLEDLRTPFIFMERPELIRETRVAHIKAAGAYSCSIGIESGDETFRQQLLKRRMSDDKIKKSFDLMHQHGIHTHAFIMMGLPGQEEEVMRESVRLLQEIQPTTAQATTFYPLPATELRDETVRQGLLDPDNQPNTYYALSALAYPLAFKKKIKMYADMVNLSLWKRSPIQDVTVWLCMRWSFLFPLVDWYMNSPAGYRRYRSIRAMSWTQIGRKILQKLGFSAVVKSR
ncbi:MAG: B12-binding domain-containing radical SAM protein [Magnetococcales bacterium]|nr:B12-binding domain-containing radical SAM protein [Magnetococcales bacterium]